MQHLLKLTILAGLSLAAPGNAQSADSDKAVGDRAVGIHRRVLTLDSHADVLLPSTPKRYFLPDGGSRADLKRLIAGGVDAVVLAVAVGPGPRDAAGVAAARKEADAKLAWIKAFVADNPGRVGLALDAGEVERLHRAGKVAVIIGFQNARSIGSDLSQFDAFYKAGVRVFAFNHAGHNAFADSSRPWNEPESVNGGLSPLGRQGVKRLNDLGALIDVSQLSTAALLQTLELTRAPVVATHSSARGLIDSTRNLSDAELDAIKANGGVVQVTPFSPYLHRQDADSLRRIAGVRARYGLPATFKGPSDDASSLSQQRQDAFIDEVGAAQSRGTLAEFVDHIDYIAKRIGWQHVGIGSDFNHGSGVIGFDSEAEALNVTRELVRRGYDEAQIKAIWGGNFLRVLGAAEAARAS
ncbi:Putative dipeptidase, pyoverdin biosynthesis PvdM [hydrothermal vent metagenome]|jgi:membrane dipeptidase|uniref:Dipeptidase, pyoverdin biosynthesis PvdM n=1 Tax=hydrothermal vent metagenome TaxID=652676 RepID=A0A160THR1_9ZZZZ